MESLIKKDIIQEVNPYMFAKIEAKINNRKTNIMPFWSIQILRVSVAVLLVILVANVFFGIKLGKTNSMQQRQQAANELYEENSYEDITNLYASEFINQK